MASLCKSTVLKVYLEVIEDVINGVKDLFLEDGVDEQVLMELKQAWETKLRATKAVENQSDVEKQGLKKLNDVNGFPKQTSQIVKQVVGQVPPNNHVQTQAVPQLLDTKLVPIQITLPAQPGTNIPPRVLTIQVPTMALQGNQLHKVLTGPIITAAMSLPPQLASTILQQHVNEALTRQQQQQQQQQQTQQQQQPQQPQQPQQQQQQQPQPQLQVVKEITKPVIQSDGMHMLDCSDNEHKPSTSQEVDNIVRLQLDGPLDTSDEDEDGTDDDDGSDEADDDKDDDEQEVDGGGAEEEPLNSEDDVTDEDPADLFDTENVVVCQYDKITRSRNKWKFHLKDGIMNLNGEDYLFQKASGDAEW